MSDKAIGERIRALRLEHGLSQKALGELCVPRIDASHIRKIESGRTSPTTETLGRISNALQTAIINDYLKDDEKEHDSLIEKYKRESSDYVMYSVLQEVCDRLRYDCERFEHDDMGFNEFDLEEDAEFLGLYSVEYCIGSKLTLTKEQYKKIFDRFIEHMAIEIKALVDEEANNGSRTEK